MYISICNFGSTTDNYKIMHLYMIIIIHIITYIHTTAMEPMAAP